jgi:anti-sigma factor RsiW
MTTFTGHVTDAQAQRLLDRALEPERDAGVEHHVSACVACQALVESYRALAAALDGLDALELPPLPDDFTAGVLSRIGERERGAVRERKLALGILAGVVAATVAIVVAAGASVWAPTVSGAADSLGSAVRAFRIGSAFVPGLVGALRVYIVIAAGILAVPMLIAIARLMPAPRAEIA